MKYNMSFTDIMLRYTGLMICGILFGLTLNYLFVILAVGFFISAMMGWCPVFHLMGIDHFKKQQH